MDSGRQKKTGELGCPTPCVTPEVPSGLVAGWWRAVALQVSCSPACDCPSQVALRSFQLRTSLTNSKDCFPYLYFCIGGALLNKPYHSFF